MPSNEDMQFARKAFKEGLASMEDIQAGMQSLAELEKNGVKKSLKDLLQEQGRLRDEPLPNAVTMELDEEDYEESGETGEQAAATAGSATSIIDRAAEGGQPSEGTDSASKEEPEVGSFIGREIGKYKITEELGKGGMGVVYRGEDERLGRVVAVKLLPKNAVGGSNQRLVDRFFREARAAAQVVHENIVQVYDMGEDEGCHFIVMQCVEGGSLQDWVRKRDLSTEQVVDLIYQAARGLAAAEEKKIVHRDIKPSNILITPDGTAKIADFGLAKNVGTDSNLTYSGQVLGTPHFMSPEQCEGAPTDSRADIYSLGATFYFSLTKRYPFTGETALSVMLKQKTEPLVPPTEYVADLPKGVCAIVQKMMAKSLDERYRSFRDVVADMELVRQGKEPDIAPQSVQPSSVSAPAARAMITVVRGRNKGNVFNVEDNMEVTIGRDSSKSALAILDAGISRFHCVIRSEHGRFSVSDCGSANGTFLNGERIESRPLRTNDRVQVGATELRFRVLPRSKDALQLVRMAYQQGHLTRNRVENALQELGEREEKGEECGMVELLLEKEYVTPEQAKGLCRQLDQKIQVLIMKERVAVPVPMPALGPAIAAPRSSVSGEVVEAAPISPEDMIPAMAPPPQRVVQMRAGLFEGLMFCDQCGDYISDEEVAEGTVKTVGSNTFCTRCLKDSPLLGEVLGSYVLWERLGQGRLGSVYRAQDEATQQSIALKIVERELSQDPAFVSRLANAIKRAAQFKHANIAAVIDTFKADAVLVVRYPRICERNLRAALLRDSPQGLRVRRMTDTDRVAEIGQHVAKALNFASDQGLAHGELGPEKVLLATKGMAKVADLGMRTTELLGDHKAPEVKDHQLVGYLDYRAPELADGSEEPSFQSDQYSLGGILFTMLAGKRFTKESQADELDADVPSPMRDVVARMISRSPKERYGTPRQLIKAIEEL